MGMFPMKPGGTHASAHLCGCGQASCLQKGRAGSRQWFLLSAHPPKKVAGAWRTAPVRFARALPCLGKEV